MQPNRDVLISELVRLRDSGRSDDLPSQFVATECRVALYALVQGSNAIASEEIIAGLMYLRMLTETALRIRWIAGDGPEAADSEGRPIVNAKVAAGRTRSMQKQDLLQLAAAHRAINEVGTWIPSPLTGDIEALARSITDVAAPRTIKDLATSDTGRKIYAGHRLCSSLIHPGASLGRSDPIARETLEGMTDSAAYFCAAFADAILRSFQTAD